MLIAKGVKSNRDPRIMSITGTFIVGRVWGEGAGVEVGEKLVSVAARTADCEYCVGSGVGVSEGDGVGVGEGVREEVGAGV